MDDHENFMKALNEAIHGGLLSRRRAKELADEYMQKLMKRIEVDNTKVEPSV